MGNDSLENQSMKEPMPDVSDVENLKPWMKANIIRPPKGYDAMQHSDRTPFSEDEQIDAYIGQTTEVIEFLKQQNRPTSDFTDVKQAILGLTQPENLTSEHK